MNEMLVTFKKLLPKKQKNIKTFHICEAPGNFIMMIDFYVKKVLKGKLDWKSQSFKPETSKKY